MTVKIEDLDSLTLSNHSEEFVAEMKRFAVGFLNDGMPAEMIFDLSYMLTKMTQGESKLIPLLPPTEDKP